MSATPKHFNIAEIINRSRWFKELPAQAKQQLQAVAKIEQYQTNDFISCAGQHSDYVGCVLEGRVRVSIISPLGHEFAITDIEPEQWVGESALFSDKDNMLETQFKEQGYILKIPSKALLNIGEQYPAIYKSIFQEHMETTRRTYELLGAMLFYPLKTRLAGRMLDMLRENGKTIEQGILLDIPLNQSDFARLCMGSRQRINKILRQWQSKGILISQDDRYIVTDVQALKMELDPEQHD